MRDTPDACMPNPFAGLILGPISAVAAWHLADAVLGILPLLTVSLGTFCLFIPAVNWIVHPYHNRLPELYGLLLAPLFGVMWAWVLGHRPKRRTSS